MALICEADLDRDPRQRHVRRHQQLFRCIYASTQRPGVWWHSRGNAKPSSEPRLRQLRQACQFGKADVLPEVLLDIRLGYTKLPWREAALVRGVVSAQRIVCRDQERRQQAFPVE